MTTEAAAEAAATTHHLSPAPALPDFETPPGMARAQFAAMGTTVTILTDTRHSAAALAAAQALFAEWEATLSRFRPESELSRLNARPGEPVAVSALLYTVLATALVAAHDTNGLYDPTLLPQLKAVGYDRSFADLPTHLPNPANTSRTANTLNTADMPTAPATARPGGHWRDIRIQRDMRRVTLPPGVELDFGGIAKGMAVDAALARLRRLGIREALVNAGGDLAVAGQPVGGATWPVGVAVRDQWWTVPLQHGAMATSGISRRRWMQGSVPRHHLLDPRTGLPVQTDLETVSVVADRCEQAEVAAKVAFIEGTEHGAAFLRTHGLSGLFVRQDGLCTPVGDWPLPY